MESDSNPSNNKSPALKPIGYEISYGKSKLPWPLKECALFREEDAITTSIESLSEYLLRKSICKNRTNENYFFTTNQDLGVSIIYKVVRQIAKGQFSTVWLATDTLDTKRFYAIKITKCSTEYKTTANKEVKLLYYVKKRNPEHFGYNRVISIRDVFSKEASCGIHNCIVFDMMSYTLRDLIDLSCHRGLDEQGSKIIIKQILEGLGYLHYSCRIVHADLKPENIFVVPNQWELQKMALSIHHFKRVDLQELEFDVYPAKSKRYAELESLLEKCNLVPPLDILSKQTVELKQPFEDKLYINPMIQIKIGGLTNSYFEKEESAAFTQTVQYRALEVIIQADYSFPIDIWSVGCIAYEMRTACYLFNPLQPIMPCAVRHVCLIWEALGDIPKNVALSGKLSNIHYTPEGLVKLINYEAQVPTTIEGVLVKRLKWKREAAKPFARFIEDLINPDCNMRLTPIRARNHQWLK